MKNLIILVGVLAFCIAGCETCDDDCICDYDHCYDTQPPAVPTGVRSITGDGYVIVVWNPVYEEDLAGYGVYRSRFELGPYARIGDVGWDEEASLVDDGVTNGMTYFYAVDAYDYNGNESDLSYETVDDTPRPEGWDLELYTTQYDPGQSAVAILPNQYDHLLVLRYDDARAQYYLTTDAKGCLRLVPLRDAYGFPNLIQDYGYTYSEDDVDEAPTDGWSHCEDGVEVIAGHTYILKTSTGYYGKIRVESMGSYWIVVYWAFQEKHGSTELAPSRKG
jgi:hypothetical protein